MLLKKTKIIATIGPASRSEAVLSRLCNAGANVFRVNFSHGSPEDHLSTVKLIREVAQKKGYEPAILADLQGPKIRTGSTLNNARITLNRGAAVTLVPGLATANATIIGIDYKGLAQEIEAGQHIMINDGAVALVADKVDKKTNKIICTILRGGSFSSHKGVNLPNIRLAIPSLTAKDRKDLEFILKNDFDYIALSFVRCANDIAKLRAILNKHKSSIRIIAKIEKPEAVADISAILAISDGIMVARGDLGVEASLPQVPLLQKELIAQAQKHDRVCIVATQMLESMIENPTPTRAEVSDVAQAILDGADAIMLSGETASGAFPVQAVDMMTEIAQTIEGSAKCTGNSNHWKNASGNTSHALCEAAVHASADLANAPIVCFSLSGNSAFTLSHLRPSAPIYAFSPSVKTRNLLAIAHNVTSFPAERMDSMLALQQYALGFLKKKKIILPGKPVVVLGGVANIPGATGFIRVVVP